MNSTMNKQQIAYAIAKAKVETLKEQAQKIEQDYMKAHDILDKNGNTPSYIWCIDDEDIFNTANAATAPTIDALGVGTAEKELKAAEDALINYSLSIVPAHIRETLENPCFGLNGDYVHIDVRAKAIDLAYRLDATTVKR